MSKRLWLCLFVLLLLVATYLVIPAGKTVSSKAEAALSTPAADKCWNPAANIRLTGASCGRAQDLQLSCYLPADMERPGLPPDFNVLQRSADIFSWQEFLALNWPAQSGERGVPDANKKLSDPGPRVWETWKEEYEVYLKDGQKPRPWNDTEPIPGACGDGASKVFFRTQKIHDVIDSTLQAAAADGTLPATLTDRQRNLVRYEIRLNKVMFDYIVENKLYNANTQVNAGSIKFPDGGILVKAAWREVTPNEEASFHTVTACVCDKKPDGTLINCQKERMGLVGFHITQKTPSAPQWIWSTFEQVNNVPGPAADGPLSFYSPGCLTCAVNRQTKPGTPNQIKRTTPIPSTNPNCNNPFAAMDNVDWLNDDVRKALQGAGSVFWNYQLVNTQWPVPPTFLKPETAFTVRPTVLANTTMETFVQPTSSCMGCHAMARTVNQNKFVSSDFSFTLNNAMPKQVNCKVLPVDSAPVTQWEKDHWADIQYGYTVATETYEKLPQNVPTAKLHCSSCHLDAGGNSDAAWWVNLLPQYNNSLPQLQARINQCFERSMNGKQLCTPAAGIKTGDCDTNAAMKGLTTYMEWLTRLSARVKPCNTIPYGFPRIPTLVGDVTNGQQTFVQKCAVCHGADGQGRYENGYYRPALWGPHSFNSAAGMFSDASDLAAFVRWNMPLGSGGLLTDQEAWDLEAFIHSKPRPQLKTPTPRSTGKQLRRRKTSSR